MSLSIILPTINRPTLRAALESVIPQLNFADECVVIGHGSLPEAEKLVHSYPQTRYFEENTPSRFGADRRNLGMDRAFGDHFIYLDDDDILVPNALKAIRSYTKMNPGFLLFFRAEILRDITGLPPLKVWLNNTEITNGNPICANLVVPNILNGPRWTPVDEPSNNEETTYLNACVEQFP